MIASLRETQTAIVGGGIIGLAIAYELAKRGGQVSLFEQGEPGHGASWAGAGMLAPFTEAIEDAQLLALMLDSLERYPNFAASVSADSGIDPQLGLDGILDIAVDEKKFQELQKRTRVLDSLGRKYELLGARETLALEPVLCADVRGSLLVHAEGQIDNRRLGRALRRACERSGVAIRSNCAVLAIEADDRRVLGVRTSAGFAAAHIVINAAGAWASGLLVPNQIRMAAVMPVKGQMLSLEIPKGLMRHVTWADGVYFVPRSDGRLLVGATVEDAGFDVRVTAHGIAYLLNRALKAAPALRNFTISETWAGLRPGTRDGRPLIGRTELEGYYLATGHYRNGILLAPATAAIIADLLEQKPNDFADVFRAQPETVSA
jgi:glycine oxidase